MSQRWMSHVAYGWIMSRKWGMSHMNESCHTRMRHVTHEWVMSVRLLRIEGLRPLQHTAALQHSTATHYTTLQQTATHCNRLQLTATNVRTSAINGRCCVCNGTATHCNTPQRTATDCNRLQQTATHTATQAATNARTSAINRRRFVLNGPCRILGFKKRHEPIALRPINIHMYIHSYIVHIYMYKNM